MRSVLTGAAVQHNRLPRKFGLLDLALLGIATHKLSRIVAKDRITGILRAPFVCYIRSAGAGEVEEEPRGRGFQRGIGHLVSCPYCMAPWWATALALGFRFRPACDALLRRDFDKHNRLGLSPPCVRQDEGRKIEDNLTRALRVRFAIGTATGRSAERIEVSGDF